MSYAIITLGGKQYRVQEGERLLVDRLSEGEGKTFNPRVLLVGGNGSTDLSPSTTVTARVVGHVLGEKVVIGKYKKRTGYRRHNGFRASLSQIEIESIGKKSAQAKAKPAAEKKAKAEAEPKPAAGLPKGYEELTVAQIAEAAPKWKLPALEAAVAHEQAHGKRKGALAALESEIALKKENG